MLLFANKDLNVLVSIIGMPFGGWPPVNERKELVTWKDLVTLLKI